MVSFFGLKFGSKKAQHKQQQLDQPPQKWKKGDPTPFTEGHPSYNFSRPQRPLSRPGTSYSSRNTMTFRAPYAGNPEASSSMVELAPPSARRPSVSSLRAASSNPNLKGGRPNISGPIGPPVPLPLNGEGSRPGTPTRPGTAGSIKRDWVNPLDVHFAKDMSLTTGPSTPKSNLSRSPLGQAEFGGSTNDGSRVTDGGFDGAMGPNGYPSPPQSIKSNDQGYVPVGAESKAPSQSNRPAAPSSLRRVNTAEQTRLPSPAVSDERSDGLMIRNINARRDTMTFHSPRRRSFSKQVEESTNANTSTSTTTTTTTRQHWQKKTEEEKEAIKKRRQTEGFEGNFAAFNFGAPPVDTSIPLPTQTGGSPESSFYRPESPVGGKTVDSVSKRGIGDSGGSGSALSRETSKEDKPAAKPLDPWTAELPRIPSTGAPKRMPSEVSSYRNHGTPSFDSVPSGSVHARGDSDTRAPGTPTALRAPPSTVAEQTQVGYVPTQERGRQVDRFNAPPALNPDKRSQSPLRSKGPIEGNFPVSNGLPRGRRPAPAPITVKPSTSSGKSAAPLRPPRDDESITVLPSWADRAERHLSALPAPLTPSGTSPSFMDKGPSPWATAVAPSSPVAPRLPSPTFPSLEKSISSSSDSFGKSFELSFGEEIAQSLGQHMIGDLSPTTSDAGRRVEKKTAPPRPPPITLPPGKSGASGSVTPTGSMKSPVRTEFSAAFI